MKLKSLWKRVAEIEARRRRDEPVREPTEDELLLLAILRHDMRIDRGAEITDEILAEAQRRFLAAKGAEPSCET